MPVSIDEREKARYGSSVHSEEVTEKYDFMMELCQKCIDQCETIVFSNKNFEVPKELLN